MLVVWKKAVAASTIGVLMLSSVGSYADAPPPEQEPEQEAALMDLEEAVMADQEAAIVERKAATVVQEAAGSSGSAAAGVTGGSATSGAGAVGSATAGAATAGLSANALTALGLVGLFAVGVVIANDDDKSRPRSVPSAPDTNTMPPVATGTTSTSGT